MVQKQVTATSGSFGGWDGTQKEGVAGLHPNILKPREHTTVYEEESYCKQFLQTVQHEVFKPGTSLS